MKKEQAIVIPPKGGKMIFKQSRYDHLAPCVFRVIAAGKSGSGKTSAMFSAVTDMYRGCFKRIVIIARTAKLDHSYIQLKDWAEKHLKQDNREKQFVYTDFHEEALMAIFNEHAQQVAKEKIQRKEDHSKEPLSQILWVVDDLSDSHNLRQRNESVLNKLFTVGRHSGQNVWLNIHALTAAGPLLRKNASMLLVFKISNSKELEQLEREYAALIGLDEFREIYKLAVGKGAPKYSFLAIIPGESEDKMFLARFDQRLVVESDSD